MRALHIETRPDPIEVARRLACAEPDVALLHAAEPGVAEWARWSFVLAGVEAVARTLDPFERDEPPLDPGVPWARAPRWVGVLPYEARRSIERPAWAPEDTRPPTLVREPVWMRHAICVCIDHHEGRVHALAQRAPLLDRVRDALSRPPPEPREPTVSVEDAEPVERHVERVAAARELILRGDLYQVNLARALELEVRAPGESLLGVDERLELHARLVRAAPTPLASSIALPDGTWVASTSPELLLSARAGAGGAPSKLLTVPIKGTRPRGRDAIEDAALVAELDADPKERAELAMIVDVERNDLGRIASTGSVRMAAPPHVVTHRTIHHRQASVVAVARPGLTRTAMLEAMVPSGSVTGAPKVRAMEVIASLEPRRRGLYTGAIGYAAHDGSFVLAMAIRTVVIGPDGRGEYWTGGGIVADSDPAREAEETRWKAVQLQAIVQGRSCP